jgi:UDP-glucose 4-epimerase
MFNVATDDYITVKEIADLALKVSGLAPGETKYEFTGGDRGWKGDVPIVRFDCAKIKALGWKAQRTSAQAVTDSMKAMREELVDA